MEASILCVAAIQTVVRIILRARSLPRFWGATITAVTVRVRVSTTPAAARALCVSYSGSNQL